MNDLEWRRGVEARIKELFQKTKMSKRAAVGGGGSGGIPIYRAVSLDLLPDGVEPYALGFITAGDLKGGWCTRNADNNEWQGLNFWQVV